MNPAIVIGAYLVYDHMAEQQKAQKQRTMREGRERDLSQALVAQHLARYRGILNGSSALAEATKEEIKGQLEALDSVTRLDATFGPGNDPGWQAQARVRGTAFRERLATVAQHELYEAIQTPESVEARNKAVAEFTDRAVRDVAAAIEGGLAYTEGNPHGDKLPGPATHRLLHRGDKFLVYDRLTDKLDNIHGPAAWGRGVEPVYALNGGIMPAEEHRRVVGLINRLDAVENAVGNGGPLGATDLSASWREALDAIGAGSSVTNRAGMEIIARYASQLGLDISSAPILAR